MSSMKVYKECKTSLARNATLSLSVDVALPVFMPVATRAAMKAVSLEDLQNEIILSNAYHCSHLGNLKELNGWKGALLTDSGGFQIGSIEGAVVTEEGVSFPYEGLSEAKKRRKLPIFTPEKSIEIQNRLGADIIMQLDDVVTPLSPRVEEAMQRSLRWLKRCIKQHKTSQLLFPIIQGGLSEDLRKKSLAGILQNELKGIAIGGLCGGESKLDFCRTIYYCTTQIRSMRSGKPAIPIYVMGVGYPEDVIMCIALGCDMMDCVYPTRTARFGRLLSDDGDICIAKCGDLSAPRFNDCSCLTCTKYSLQYLHSIRNTSNFSMLVTLHNLHYMHNLVGRAREAIQEGIFPEFVVSYMRKRFLEVPHWVEESLGWLKISLIEILQLK